MNQTFLLKLFWPEICPFCGRASRQGVCSRCQKRLKALTVKEPMCMKCGKPLRLSEQEFCRDCARTQHYFERGAALWLHREPVNLSIYQFKFHNQRRFGVYYAMEMAARYEDTVRRWDPDVIMPIPLYRAKLRKRGYNQAAVVARELGGLLKIPVDTETFKRVRGTNPLKTLNPAERKQNLSNAFAVAESQKEALRGKTVLLIDDIYTTGSTMDEAAKILKRAGAENVFYLTISIGQGY